MQKTIDIDAGGEDVFTDGAERWWKLKKFPAEFYQYAVYGGAGFFAFKTLAQAEAFRDLLAGSL